MLRRRTSDQRPTEKAVGFFCLITLFKEVDYQMRFKSQQHKSTFKKAIRKKDKTDNKLMAAMYLLTADLPLWNRVKGSIRENSIDFDEIRLNTVTENGYTLYSASKDMYFNTDHVSLSDIFDTKLIPEKMFNPGFSKT